MLDIPHCCDPKSFAVVAVLIRLIPVGSERPSSSMIALPSFEIWNVIEDLASRFSDFESSGIEILPGGAS